MTAIEWCPIQREVKATRDWLIPDRKPDTKPDNRTMASGLKLLARRYREEAKSLDAGTSRWRMEVGRLRHEAKESISSARYLEALAAPLSAGSEMGTTLRKMASTARLMAKEATEASYAAEERANQARDARRAAAECSRFAKELLGTESRGVVEGVLGEKAGLGTVNSEILRSGGEE